MFCGFGSKEVINVLPGCAEATSLTKAVNIKSANVRMASDMKKSGGGSATPPPGRVKKISAERLLFGGQQRAPVRVARANTYLKAGGEPEVRGCPVPIRLGFAVRCQLPTTGDR